MIQAKTKYHIALTLSLFKLKTNSPDVPGIVDEVKNNINVSKYVILF
jgi:hypothetical protein